MTSAITTTSATDATTPQSQKKAHPSSPFDDPDFFAEAIDQVLHSVQAMNLREEAQAVLDLFTGRGALGHGSIAQPFRAHEVVAFFQLLAAKADAEKRAIFTEVADTIGEACRLEGPQHASAERLERFSGFLESRISLANHRNRLKNDQPAENADDTHATMRRSGPLAFLSGGLPTREPNPEAEPDFVDLSPGPVQTMLFNIATGEDVSDAELMDLLVAKTNP